MDRTFQIPFRLPEKHNFQIKTFAAILDPTCPRSQPVRHLDISIYDLEVLAERFYCDIRKMRQRWESVREKIYAQMRGEEHMGGVFKQCVSFLGRRRTARHLKALCVLLPSVEGVFVATETRLLREELTNNLSIALALASIRSSLIFDTFNYTL